MDLSVDAKGLVLVESLEEDGTKVVGTGTGDGLDGSYALLGNGWGVGAEDKLGSSVCEFGKTGDGEVFVVDSLVCDEVCLCLFNGRKNVRLAVVVTVCANTEIDFFVVGVGLVGSGQLEDAVVVKSARRVG